MFPDVDDFKIDNDLLSEVDKITGYKPPKETLAPKFAYPPETSKANALRNAADKLGVDAADLGAIIGFESRGTYDPHVVGGEGNNYRGLIQFGIPEQKKYYRAGQSFEDQVQDGVVRYFQDRFKTAYDLTKNPKWKTTNGATLEDLYTTVIAGNPSANRDKTDSFGTSARSGTQRIMREHRPAVLKKFFGGQDTATEFLADTNLLDEVDNILGQSNFTPDANLLNDVGDTLGTTTNAEKPFAGNITTIEPSVPDKNGVNFNPSAINAVETPAFQIDDNLLSDVDDILGNEKTPKFSAVDNQIETLGGLPNTENIFPQTKTEVPQTVSEYDAAQNQPDDYKEFLKYSELTDSPEARNQYSKTVIEPTAQIEAQQNAQYQKDVDNYSRNATASPVSAQNNAQTPQTLSNPMATAEPTPPNAYELPKDETKTQIVKNDEDLRRTVAGVANVDLSKKPKGVSVEDYLFSSALDAVGSRYNLTPEQKQTAINAVRQSAGKLLSGDYSRITDENIKDLPDKNFQITLTRNVINAALTGQVGGQIADEIRKDFQNEQTERNINLNTSDASLGKDEFGDDIKARDRNASFDRQIAEYDKGDAYRKAEREIIAERRADPFEDKGDPTPDEIKSRVKQYEDAERTARKLEETPVFGSLLSGLIGGTGRVTRAVAGAVRPFSFLIGDEPYNFLKKIGDQNVILEQVTNKDGGFGTSALKALGGAGLDIPRLVALSRLPGGAVVGFATDAGLQASGSGKNAYQIAKETTKGASMGALFGLSEGVASKASSELLKPVARIGTITGGTYAVNRAFGATHDEAVQSAIMNGLFDVVQTYGTSALGKVFKVWNKGEAQTVRIEPDGKVNLLKETEIPVDAELVLDPTDGVYKQSAEVGQTKRLKGQDKDFDAMTPDNQPNNDVDYTRQPVGELNGNSQPQNVLAERNPTRIETAKPEAVQKAAIDTRARKLTDILKTGDTFTVDDLAKQSRFNKKNVEDTVMTLFEARRVEILPDNSVRLIGDDVSPKAQTIFERAQEIQTKAKNPIELPEADAETKLNEPQISEPPAPVESPKVLPTKSSQSDVEIKPLPTEVINRPNTVEKLNEFAKPTTKAEIVRVGGKQVELTPEQSERWRTEVTEPLAQAKKRLDRDMAQNPRYREEYQATYKGESMRIAAKKREITELLTPTEQREKEKREKSNYIGKDVSVNGQNGKVVGTSFGKVKVQFEDGTEKRFEASEIQKPITSPLQSQDQQISAVRQDSNKKVDSELQTNSNFYISGLGYLKPAGQVQNGQIEAIDEGGDTHLIPEDIAKLAIEDEQLDVESEQIETNLENVRKSLKRVRGSTRQDALVRQERDSVTRNAEITKRKNEIRKQVESSDFKNYVEDYRTGKIQSNAKVKKPFSAVQRAALRRSKDATPEELRTLNLEPLGEKGAFGQTSHKIRQAMYAKDSNFLNDISKVFDVEIDRNDISNSGNAVLDAISSIAGKNRSSQLDNSDWKKVLDAHADRMNIESVKVIEDALSHQEEFNKKITEFSTGKELAAILDETDLTKSFKLLPLKTRKSILKLGREYNISDEQIKSAYDRTVSELVEKKLTRRGIDETGENAAAESENQSLARGREELPTEQIESGDRLAKLRQTELNTANQSVVKLIALPKLKNKWKGQEGRISLSQDDIKYILTRFYEGRGEDATPLKEVLVNWRRAGLLTSVRTHLRNILSNGINQVSEEAIRPIAFLADLAASAKTGQRTVQLPNAKALGQSFASLVRQDATFKYLNKKSAMAKAVEIMKTGDAEELEKNQLSEMKSGSPIVDKFVNTTFRLLGAEDALFKVYSFRRSLEEQAKTMAITEAKGRTDKREFVNRRQAELIAKPTPLMAMEAEMYADFTTFTNDNVLSDLFKMLKEGGTQHSNKTLAEVAKWKKSLLEIVVPYDKTPMNIIARTLEHTPLGYGWALTHLYNLKRGDSYQLSKLREKYKSDFMRETERLKDIRKPSNEKFEQKMESLDEAIDLAATEAERTTLRAEKKAHREAFNRLKSQRKLDDFFRKEDLDELNDRLDELFPRIQQQAFARSFGRASLGTTALLLGGYLASKSLLSGIWDAGDKEERNVYFDNLDEGILNGSLVIGGRRYQIADTPIGKVMALGASVYERMNRNAETPETVDKKRKALQSILDDSEKSDDVKEVAKQRLDELNNPKSTVAGDTYDVGKNLIMEQPLLNSLDDYFGSGKTPTQRASALLGSFVPAISADVADVSDDENRETPNKKGDKGEFYDGLMNRIPGLRQKNEISDYPREKYLQDRTNRFVSKLDPTASRPVQPKLSPREQQIENLREKTKSKNPRVRELAEKKLNELGVQ